MADILAVQKPKEPPYPDRRKMSGRSWLGLIVGVVSMVTFGITVISIATGMEARLVTLKLTIDGNEDVKDVEVQGLVNAMTGVEGSIKELKVDMGKGFDELRADIKQILRRGE